MSGNTVEHVKDAAPILGQYFDILCIRTFPSLKNREDDYSELVMNSAKYAKGKITVRLSANPSKGHELTVSDNGPGFPKGFDPGKSKGLGMKIVSSLVNQIGGRSLFGANPLGQGAQFTVLFTPNENAAFSA